MTWECRACGKEHYTLHLLSAHHDRLCITCYTKLLHWNESTSTVKLTFVGICRDVANTPENAVLVDQWLELGRPGFT